MTVTYRDEHDLSSVIRNGLGLYAANYRPLFLIALITAPLQMLLAVTQRQVDSEVATAWISAGIQLPLLLVTVIATGAVIHAVHAISGGAAANAGDSLDAGFGRFGALLTTNLLEGVLIAASLLAFIGLPVWWLTHRDATIDGRRDWWLLLPFVLPVYLLGRWIMAAQAVVIEGKARWSALDASAASVRGQWWRVLGIMLVVGLMLLGPALIAAASGALPPLGEATIVATISALTLPFYAAAQTLLYYDLQARRSHDGTGAA